MNQRKPQESDAKPSLEAVRPARLGEKGGTAFLLDVMVAQGELIRWWSEEQGEFAYRNSDIPQVSRLTV